MTPEEFPFLDSGNVSGIPNSRLEAIGTGTRHRHSQPPFPEGLAEVCLCVFFFFLNLWMMFPKNKEILKQF